MDSFRISPTNGLALKVVQWIKGWIEKLAQRNEQIWVWISSSSEMVAKGKRRHRFISKKKFIVGDNNTNWTILASFSTLLLLAYTTSLALSQVEESCYLPEVVIETVGNWEKISRCRVRCLGNQRVMCLPAGYYYKLHCETSYSHCLSLHTHTHTLPIECACG